MAQPRKIKGYASDYHRQLSVLLLPFLIGTIVLIVVPALLTFGLAFTQYDALSPPIWHGLSNFQTIIREPLFQIAVRNSLYFIVLAVPLRVVGALMLALLFNQRRRGVGLYRVAVYIPTVIPDVAYALIWLWLLNPIYGPINQVLQGFGLPAPAWLVDSGTAKLALVLMALFQIGEGFVVLLAGLQAIPLEYYDAAAMDGANRWNMVRFITLPMLAPWLTLLTIRDIISSAQNTLTPSLLMTRGDPYYATLFLPFLIYQEAFDRFRFGTGAAMMVLMFLGIGMLLWLGSYVVRGWGYLDDH